MALYKTEGIVLHQFELGEADKIITYFTKDKGKVRAVAKGVRRPLSKKASSVQLFTYAEILVYKGKSLDSISQSDIRKSFSPLREDLIKMAYGTYILDLIKEVTVEENPQPFLFALLLRTLYLLMEEEDSELITRIFEIRAMTLIGFQPVLNVCIECNSSLKGEKLVFHPGSGGLICSKCKGRAAGTTLRISQGTVKMMRLLLTVGYDKLFKIKFAKKYRRELKQTMESFIRYHLDKKLRSLSFLKSVTSLK